MATYRFEEGKIYRALDDSTYLCRSRHGNRATFGCLSLGTDATDMDVKEGDTFDLEIEPYVYNYDEESEHAELPYLSLFDGFKAVNYICAHLTQ